MAAVSYVGKQIARAKVMTLTVNTADTAAAVTFTGGNGQVCVVTPSSTTVATAASDFVTALSAAGGVFGELSFTSSGAVVTITGPADGAPFDFSKSDGGSNSTTLTTTVAPLSPYDVSDVLNYSTGALPVNNTDSLTVDGPVSMKYNADALAAITLASPGFTRRATHIGTLGLPPTNPAGYPEYRQSELQIKSTAYLIEMNQNDQAAALRIQNMHSSAVTMTIQGDQNNAQAGGEVLQVSGLPASSTVNCVNASVSLAPYLSQTCIFSTLAAQGSTISIGSSATPSGTVTLVDCTASIKASWSTSLTIDGQSTVTIGGSAAGVIVLDGGTMTWLSTGNIGARPKIGNGATLDLSKAPATISAVTYQLYAGATLNDSAGRGGNWAAKLNRCTLSEVNLILPNDKTITLS